MLNSGCLPFTQGNRLFHNLGEWYAKSCRYAVDVQFTRIYSEPLELSCVSPVYGSKVAKGQELVSTANG